MSIKRTFNGATIIKPGAYSKIVVENLSGFPLAATGVVGIVGEAVGGEPRVLDIISGMGIQDAKARYKSGPIADALELLVNPSRDARIANGASKIVIYKVNASTQSASALKNTQAVPVSAIDLKSKNYGADEDQISMTSSVGGLEDATAVLSGSIAGPFTLVGGETLILKAGASTYTFTGSLSGAQTATALVGDLNNASNWAPSKPVVASLVSGTQRIQLALDVATLVGQELDYGYLKVDAASTLDTLVGITGEARGKKGSRILTFVKGVTEEASLDLGGVAQLSIKYVGAGTDAVLDIKKVSGELRLQTTCTGASSDNLDILLKDAEGKEKHTLKTLADLIDSKAAYECSVVGPQASVNASKLDFYDDLRIIDVAAKLHKDVADVADYLNGFSLLVEAEKLDNVYRAIELISTPRFFAGGSDGSSLNSDWADGFEALKEERINVVVPLISKDIGSLTVDSINALAANHAAWGWSTGGKSERHVFVSRNGSKSVVKDAAKALQSGYVSLVAQQPQVLNKAGELQWMDEWAMACLCAGQRAGAEVGEPLTFKLFNANGLRVLDGSWNPRKDFAEMIEAGVWIGEPLDTGGFRHVVGNTTYGVDASFVWNRESVVQASGFVAYDLRLNLELVFTGTKARTGTAEAVANFIKNRMSSYLSADIIVGDDLNEGLGYKNLRVLIEGNTAIINVSITPVQGIDFILPTIYLADIRQSA